MSLKTLYQAMLGNQHSQDALSAEMQTRIFDYSCKQQDWSTIVALAKYSALDPTVDAQIKKQDQLDVLHAWVTRPGRTSDELVERILSDKRVNVLLPLAAIHGLDAKVYQTIAKIKSPKLGEVLATNPSVPDNIRLAKVREYALRAPRGAHQRHEELLHKICCANMPDTTDIVRRMYEAVAETTLITPWIVACLQRPYVRESDLNRWIDQLTHIYEGGDGQWYWRNAEITTMIGSKTLNPEQRAKLLANAKSYVATQGQRWRIGQLNDVIATIESTNDEFEKLLGELEQETDPTRSDYLVATLRVSCKADDLSRLAGIVARHQYVSVAVGMTLLAHIPASGYQNDLKTFILRLEAEREYDHLIEVIEKQSGGSHYLPMPVRFLAQAEQFLRYYAKQEMDAGRNLPDWFTETNLINRDLELAVKALRWPRLCQSLSNFPGLALLVEQRMLETLGTDVTRWEAFTTLSHDFDGSLEDLLGAAASL